ncbi:uncharacterized protein K02A2.6-like [Cimex lectularius]|uniref:RNA-directed DNA polymerase n=1 Tax=Cimex lectularius TaxID=79782 RepID=A0A8I6SMR6_CIMLE|nr:uncharacterized protein K02A2.6-like [Cimex lectularius]
MCSLKLKSESITPRFVKHRNPPYALESKVNEELDVLEKEGVIEKTDYAEWGSPLVTLPKKNGEVRLCVDYKITINPYLQDSNEPMPIIEEVLHELRDAKIFCKLDIHKAYLHLQMDANSQRLLTITTPRGAYLMKRLPFGVKTAPKEFHKFMRQSLQGSNKVVSYFDDIVVYGNDVAECYDNLKRCLDRLHELKMHLNEKSLPNITASRLLRYAMIMNGFDFEVKHRKAECHRNADYLSRAPLSPSSKEEEEEETDEDYEAFNIVINQISSENITLELIARETDADEVLKKLKDSLYDGTNNSYECSIHNGAIFRGPRVIIPKSLQSVVLQELHATHLGVVKMKGLARRYCYWRGLDHDIESLVRGCQECQNVRANAKKVTLHKWDVPERNWQRLHMDYAGPYLNQHIFILVDAKSKWIEAKILKEAPTSAGTINILKELFIRYGVPVVLVSDNATIFKSVEFSSFCTNHGIQQKFSAPGHPATNGQAERVVQIIKNKLKSMMNEQASGTNPAENFLGWNLRTKLDLIIRSPTSERVEQPHLTTASQLSVGERIAARIYSQNEQEKWAYGTVEKRLGRVHYNIKLNSGYVLKRHKDQLRRCEVPASNQDGLDKLQQPISTQSQEPATSNGSSQERDPARLEEGARSPNVNNRKQAATESPEQLMGSVVQEDEAVLSPTARPPLRRSMRICKPDTALSSHIRSNNNGHHNRHRTHPYRLRHCKKNGSTELRSYTTLPLSANHLEWIPQINQYLATFPTGERLKIIDQDIAEDKLLQEVFLINPNNSQVIYRGKHLNHESRSSGKPNILANVDLNFHVTQMSKFKVHLQELNLQNIPSNVIVDRNNSFFFQQSGNHHNVDHRSDFNHHHDLDTIQEDDNRLHRATRGRTPPNSRISREIPELGVEELHPQRLLLSS